MSSQTLLEELWNAAQRGDVAKVDTCLQMVRASATKTGRGLLVSGAGTAAKSGRFLGMCDLTSFLFAALQVAAVIDWPDTVKFLADSLWAEIQCAECRRGARWFDVIMATTYAGSERAMSTLLQSDSFGRIGAANGRYDHCAQHSYHGRDRLAGHTMLTAAAACGHVGVVRAILQHERTSMLEETNSRNQDPLEIAVREGHVDVARTLLEAKAQLCHRGGKSALVAAVEGGFVNAVQLLVDAKANVNRGPVHPLELAHQQGRDDVVQLLLDAKADVNFATEPPSDDDADAEQSDGEW
jgi:hypothetical protein